MAESARIAQRFPRRYRRSGDESTVRQTKMRPTRIHHLSGRPRATRVSPGIVAPLAIALMCACGEAAAQEPAAPQAVPAAQLQAAIDKLGNLDYATRTNAARTV